ncbi:MAG: DNA polymerase, partial [Phycisphaerae bacterium]|nr:DNA polymerase [Phycisphaerae bacterium]
YRQLVKLKGTYVDALPRLIDGRTGRLHPNFTQTRTATGRLACQDPNLQNIPIRTELGRQIRRAFVPGTPANVLLTADYSQIELRMLAHFSQDPALMRAFAEDQDIHTFVAAQVFDVMPQMVDPEQRRRAKAVNFGIIYGQTPFGLAKSLGIPQSEAKEFIDAYFKRYATIGAFIEECHRTARANGYVTTILGRRRPIPDINSSNKMQKALAERTAVNTVTQGSAADLIKLAMINIHRRIGDEHRPAKMLIQVHDELVFEMPASSVEAEAEMIRKEMTGAIPLKVPLKVDVAWGRSWLEAK